MNAVATRFSVAHTLWVFAVLWMLLLVRVGAVDITLAWDSNPEPDIAEYIVRYGTASNQYGYTIEAGARTSVTLAGLAPGTYYCTVIARNSAGLESPPAAELMFDAVAEVPTLVGLANGQALNGPGIVNLRANSFGSDFTRLEFYVDGIKVGEVNSATESASWQPPQAGDYTVTVNGYNASGFVATSTLDIHIVKPTVTDLKRTTDSAFEMTVIGAPGRMQRVEVSDDLQHWTPFAAEVNTTGAMVVRDEAMAQTDRRFYRVISE